MDVLCIDDKRSICDRLGCHVQGSFSGDVMHRVIRVRWHAVLVRLLHLMPLIRSGELRSNGPDTPDFSWLGFPHVTELVSERERYGGELDTSVCSATSG